MCFKVKLLLIRLQQICLLAVVGVRFNRRRDATGAKRIQSETGGSTGSEGPEGGSITLTVFQYMDKVQPNAAGSATNSSIFLVLLTNFISRSSFHFLQQKQKITY